MTFACIQMDPPWGERGGGGRGAQDHYDVIDDRSENLRTIVTAECWRPAADAHLWCWTTLGFRYVTHFTWVKLNDQPDLLSGQMAPAITRWPSW